MKWANFSRILGSITPWNYDFYFMYWGDEKTKQEFLDLIVKELGMVSFKYLMRGTSIYFMVKKGTTLTEAFSSAILVEDSPSEPPPEPEE